jgi:23S rRNA pseudouridine1911/1915/1917 synthase
MTHADDSITILYEDNHLLGVYKPAGMLVQGDRTGDLSRLDWAKAWIKTKYGKPGRVFVGLVHRLDRPVPGVVLFARTSKSAARLSAQFREHRIMKMYWAVVHGHIQPPQGTSRVYMGKEGRTAVMTSSDDPKGKYAELSYRTIETVRDASLMQITLKTGRHHQIRAQLAAMGHPILGDRKYGSRITTPMIGLLSKALTFRHPTKPMDITIESPLPTRWPWPPPSAAAGTPHRAPPRRPAP